MGFGKGSSKCFAASAKFFSDGVNGSGTVSK